MGYSPHPHHPVFFGKYTGAGIQVSPSRQHPKVLVGLHLQDPAPTKSKVEVGRAKVGGGGQQSRECGQGYTKFKSKSSVPGWYSVPRGLEATPPTQASYFLPVRWMCWKRVMEKAMPRICIMRMHIPTVPSTCLLSSNHIFTFS